MKRKMKHGKTWARKWNGKAKENITRAKRETGTRQRKHDGAELGWRLMAFAGRCVAFPSPDSSAQRTHRKPSPRSPKQASIACVLIMETARDIIWRQRYTTGHDIYRSLRFVFCRRPSNCMCGTAAAESILIPNISPILPPWCPSLRIEMYRKGAYQIMALLWTYYTAVTNWVNCETRTLHRQEENMGGWVVRNGNTNLIDRSTTQDRDLGRVVRPRPVVHHASIARLSCGPRTGGNFGAMV